MRSCPTASRCSSGPTPRNPWFSKNVLTRSEVVQPKTLSIVSRSIATLIKNQNLGELYRIHRMAEDGGAEFNFVAVPPSFDVKSKQFFDPVYQSALFEEGRRMGRDGVPWARRPPL